MLELTEVTSALVPGEMSVSCDCRARRIVVELVAEDGGGMAAPLVVEI